MNYKGKIIGKIAKGKENKDEVFNLKEYKRKCYMQREDKSNTLSNITFLMEHQKARKEEKTAKAWKVGEIVYCDYVKAVEQQNKTLERIEPLVF